MPAHEPPGSSAARRHQVTTALWLSTTSVIFGISSGAVSITTGLHDHSLGVFAIGAGVLVDVTGSAVLIWRFSAERHQPGRSGPAESRAAVLVALALALASVVIAVQSVLALTTGSRPGTSSLACWPPAPRLPSSPRWPTPSTDSAGGWAAALCRAMAH